jgi:phage-related protein
VAEQVADLFAALGLKPIESQWKRGSELINGVKTALVGLGAVLGVRAFAGMVQDTVNVASHAVDAANKLGITAEAVQELGYAASQSGSDLDSITTGLSKFALTLEAARKGNKEARKSFKELGVRVKDFKGKNLDQGLEIVAEAFSKIEDPVKRLSVASAILGKQGTGLVEFLGLGRDGIAELRTEAQELNGVLSNETAGALEAFGDQQAKVKVAVQGLKNEIAVALLPVLQDVAQGMIGWVKANREAIVSGIHTFVAGLVSVFRVLAKVGTIVAEVVGLVADNIDIVIVAVAGLSAAFGGVLAPVLVLIKALDYFFTFQEVIDGISFGIEVVADMIAIMRKAFASAISYIGSSLRSMWGAVSGVARTIADAFIGAASAIRNAFESAFNWIADKADWLWNKIPGPIRDALDFVVDVTGDLVGGAVDLITGGEDTAATVPVDAVTAGAGSQAAVMTRPVTSMASAGTVNVDVRNELNVEAGRADAREVASLTGDTLNAFKSDLERELVHASALTEIA